MKGITKIQNNGLSYCLIAIGMPSLPCVFIFKKFVNNLLSILYLKLCSRNYLRENIFYKLVKRPVVVYKD